MGTENRQIQMVVFDWAGTTVDYGSSAPSVVFDRVLTAAGLHLTREEINRPMGLEKKAHIRQLLSSESGSAQWQQLYGRVWNEQDVDKLYETFEATLHTVGTGSEVTCWATIWDPEQDTKRSLENHDNYAAAALVDPELAAGMPVRLAVSSALDAVAHAVESYWARHTNAVSRALALEAIRTVMGSIDQLFTGAPAAHDAMARGSMLAGLAFSNTKTTACHSISYPLTMHYGIPHGAAVAMLLAPVLACNAPAVQDLDALLGALGVADAAGLQRRIAGLLVRSAQPASLEGWGVARSDLAHLAGLGITKGRADNNPVELTPALIEEMLESIYPMATIPCAG